MSTDIAAIPSIAVAVIKDKSDEHYPDPVMLLSGGPGEKTVHNVPALAEILDHIHPNRDLILFDQRGVGLSEPALECPEFMQSQLDSMKESDIGDVWICDSCGRVPSARNHPTQSVRRVSSSWGSGVYSMALVPERPPSLSLGLCAIPDAIPDINAIMSMRSLW